MPERAAVDWLLIAVCVLTYALLVAELVSLGRRALRLKTRAERLAESPLFAAPARAQAAADRLANASLEAQALVVRAILAIVRIRATVLTLVGFARTLSGR